MSALAKAGKAGQEDTEVNRPFYLLIDSIERSVVSFVGQGDRYLNFLMACDHADRYVGATGNPVFVAQVKTFVKLREQPPTEVINLGEIEEEENVQTDRRSFLVKDEDGEACKKAWSEDVPPDQADR